MSWTVVATLMVCMKIVVLGAVTTDFQNFLDNNTTVDPGIKCPYFGRIEHGFVIIKNQIAIVNCIEGYDLHGAPNIYCIDGKWEQLPRPQCIKRCQAAPYLKNGFMEVDRDQDENGLYHVGTLVTYSCDEGFDLIPKESKYRVCEKGFWTGAFGICQPIKKITGCTPPRDIENGYFVHENPGDLDELYVGLRLHYSCKSGYVLVGPRVQQCLDDGTWSPKIPPVCSLNISEELGDDYSCPPSPTVPHSYTTLVQGYQNQNIAVPGTIVLIHCFSKYKNTKALCQPGKLQCVRGRWVGSTPLCEPARDCDPPPAVSYAEIYNLNPEFHDYPLTNKYPIKSKISYQCLPGYSLQGKEILACSPGGCWLPMEPPTCYHTTNNNYFLEVNNINAVLISGATGAGVLGLLLVICLITICRRRKPLIRAAPIAPPVQRTDLSDHATLLHHPDRLALIAFADGMQNEQASLPTYDEATRDRALNLTSNRFHRPHWPNLGGRRSRNPANPADMVHVTRHGSFASHTPSTRSAGDSMGSTDTVAVSEGSTNVTLDTVSSYSGSQPASCRVHCGSLASFDTSSVVNTEGVPLLEENELEETHGGDNLSLVVDNPSISDNASHKLSTHSADLF